jgi:hypothetical protein
LPKSGSNGQCCERFRTRKQGNKLWVADIQEKHDAQPAKRRVADILIEAFAQRFQGLITRNPKHFTMVTTNRSATVAGSRARRLEISFGISNLTIEAKPLRETFSESLPRPRRGSARAWP